MTSSLIYVLPPATHLGWLRVWLKIRWVAFTCPDINPAAGLLPHVDCHSIIIFIPPFFFAFSFLCCRKRFLHFPNNTPITWNPYASMLCATHEYVHHINENERWRSMLTKSRLRCVYIVKIYTYIHFIGILLSTWASVLLLMLLLGLLEF